KSRPRLQSIADVHLEGILLARDRRDSPLSVVRVGFSPVFFGQNSYSAARRHFQGKGKSGDAAAQDQIIEMSDGFVQNTFQSGALSISRVWPMNTAKARRVPRRIPLTGSRVSG